MSNHELRKIEHIEQFRKQVGFKKNYFDYLHLDNETFPNLDFEDLDSSIHFMNKKMDYPLIINAITGGFPGAVEINGFLSELAAKYKIAFAVGSQSVGLNGQKESYQVAREKNANGILIGNLSINKSLQDAQIAIDMISANALQLHLNVPQELAMAEGDRNFTGLLDHGKRLKEHLKVPVILKEVGFGISVKSALQIRDAGFRFLDVGGKGGTNFIEIEDKRSDQRDLTCLYDWGISTPHSIMNVRQVDEEICIIATGGIRNGLDMAKAIALGADVVGMAGVIFNAYLEEGPEGAEKLLSDIIYQFRMVMLMTGSKNVNDLSKVNIMADERFLLNKAKSMRGDL